MSLLLALTGPTAMSAVVRYSKPQWRSFSDEPIRFGLIATVYVTTFLALGGAAIAKLVDRLKRR